MIWKILIVQPFPELRTAHELFAFFMPSFVVGEIEVIDISACAYGHADSGFLFIGWVNFRFEAFQHSSHPPQSTFILAKANLPLIVVRSAFTISSLSPLLQSLATHLEARQTL